MQRPTYVEFSFNVGVTHHPIPNPGSNTDATVIYYTVLMLMVYKIISIHNTAI